MCTVHSLPAGICDYSKTLHKLVTGRILRVVNSINIKYNIYILIVVLLICNKVENHPQTFIRLGPAFNPSKGPTTGFSDLRAPR
jgi:hypothetical protein